MFPATIFYLAWYMGFILLAAYAESFMSRSVYEGLTVGYVLALTQFLMVLVLGLVYLPAGQQHLRPARGEGDREVRRAQRALRDG